MLVSTSNAAYAYAYKRVIAGFCILVVLAGCVAKGSTGQDSFAWTVFELRCLASNTFLRESFFSVNSKDSEK